MKNRTYLNYRLVILRLTAGIAIARISYGNSVWHDSVPI